MKNKYQISYFINVMVIQNNALRIILGWDIRFVYPNRDCTHWMLLSFLKYV
jgi:hypothetical protein